MQLEAFIQEEAKRLGFAAVGFAPVGPSRTFARFRKWLARDYAGEMSYLSGNTEIRSHPSRLAPYAKSVIMVAAAYPSTRRSEYWSNYVRGDDYHVVLRLKLKHLEQVIRERVAVPLQARICVDTAPLLEREWACRAGLGWIGRQGSLVHPALGCCLFLGALLVNLELEASPPIASQCGDCRLCLEACPAGAIQPDGLVDARRCIAYLTIEHKGNIPESLRSCIGSSLYGCDRCTSVCPRNCQATDFVMPEFRGSDQPRPAPKTCLAMTAAEFEIHFAGTAVQRIGLQRLQRNARIVLNNQAR